MVFTYSSKNLISSKNLHAAPNFRCFILSVGGLRRIVIKTLLAVAARHGKASFYRSVIGAEIDLVLELGGQHGTWTIDIKRSLAPTIGRGFHNAIDTLCSPLSLSSIQGRSSIR